MAADGNHGEISRDAAAAGKTALTPAAPAGPLRPFARSLPMALLRAREAVMRHFRPSLQGFDLTEQQWRVLRALASLDEIDVTGLANATFLLAPSLTRILRDLERRKVVRRRADPTDLRAALISLSPRGRALVDEVGVESERIYSALEARFGQARMATLMALLAEAESEFGEPLSADGNPFAQSARDSRPTARAAVSRKPLAARAAKSPAPTPAKSGAKPKAR